MSEPEIGSKVDDKFILLELIGSGASGSVYKARHIFLDEEIAIKFVSTDLFESPESAERFKREAAVLSSMSHSNIVKFHSFGFADGRYYMALELLKGQTLAAMIAQDGALSEANALDIFLDICAGLAYVHEKGIVHRDVKPGNVMISSNEAGRCCKLLDFGILKNFAEDQKLTKTGLFVGSSNYMSPEQCKGIALDGRSDIYSLGCLIYETLVGKAPMDDESDLLIMSKSDSEKYQLGAGKARHFP